MGIDVYARWEGMTEDERNAQYTGFSIHAGGVGYLREAYHGGPYATQILFAECFEEGTGQVPIPPETLRERLPVALATAEERERSLYRGDDESVTDALKSFTDFVELYERKAAEGKNPSVYVSY